MKKNQIENGGESALISAAETPAQTTTAPETKAKRSAVSRKRKLPSSAEASGKAKKKLTNLEGKNLARREYIVKCIQEEIDELDASIRQTVIATGAVDPVEEKIRRLLARQLNQVKKLLFPDPVVLSDFELEEISFALEAWKTRIASLHEKQPVAH